MKKSRLVYVASLFIVALIISSCGGLKKMLKEEGNIKYTVDPPVLEMHGDSVKVTITGTIPQKFFHKKVVVEGTPALVWEGGEKSMKKEIYQGEKVQGNNKIIKYESGGTFNFTDKIAYEEGMRVSKLEVRLQGYKGKDASKPDKKVVDFTKKEVAKGVIATPGLVQMDSKVISAKDNFVRTSSESKDATILFDMTKSNLKPTELKKDEVKALQDFITQAQQDKRREYKGMQVDGQASPDGPVQLNDKLSKDRAKTTEDFVNKEFKEQEKKEKEVFIKKNPKDKDLIKKFQPKQFDFKTMFKSAGKGQDWDGFKAAVQGSNIQDKDLIVRVLSMYSDPDQRNKEIKNLKQIFTILKDKVLPQLRKSAINVKVDIVGYSDEELLQLAESTPDSLKIEEILKAATVTKDLNRQLKIYQAAARKYGDDWRTHNNVGYTQFMLNNTADAKKAFEDAKAKKAETMVFNNLGACYLKEKDFAKAKELLTSAGGAGNEVNYNLGIINIKKAEYKDAVSNFGSYNTMNSALAKLLNANVDDAIKALDNAENKDDAMVYYLKAVCGARKQNAEILFNNLRSAVGKDASLSAKAKTDMEFLKWFEDDTFKNIVK
ncbi:MAG: hypothetical protein HY840_13380 [Bacteroidetes bacterium]|nr:hypothetical protein [Bacteroidota bacterium]